MNDHHSQMLAEHILPVCRMIIPHADLARIVKEADHFLSVHKRIGKGLMK